TPGGVGDGSPTCAIASALGTAVAGAGAARALRRSSPTAVPNTSAATITAIARAVLSTLTAAGARSPTTAAGGAKGKRDRAVADRLHLDAIGRRVCEQVLVRGFVHTHPSRGVGSGSRRDDAGLGPEDPRPGDRYSDERSARVVDDAKAHCDAVVVELEE